MWPVTLRPAFFDCFSTRRAYGPPLCRSGLTSLTTARRPGEVGLTLTRGTVYSWAWKVISCFLPSGPGRSDTYAFFQLRRRPSKRPKRLSLPRTFTTCTALTLVLNISSTAALICGLVASAATRNTYWLFFSPTKVLFSDTSGER